MPFDFISAKRSDWQYKDCFTIDPVKAARAWDVLNTNEAAIRFGLLPKTLHFALVKTLEERKTLERFK